MKTEKTLDIETATRYCKELADTVITQSKTIDQLKLEYEVLKVEKEEASKAETLFSFEVPYSKRDILNKWQLEHMAQSHNCHTLQEIADFKEAIGTLFTFDFEPCLEGYKAKCKCACCDAEIDISDT